MTVNCVLLIKKPPPATPFYFKILSQSIVCSLPAPSSPSVSMTTTRCTGSIAAHTPTVQDSWVGEVVNTSRPRKNVWFRVWDFPSPVFPKMETTLRSSSGLQPSLLTKSSSSFTWESTQDQPHLHDITLMRSIKGLKHALKPLPASPPSRPPKGSCTPSPALLSGSLSVTPHQSRCYPGQLWRAGKVSEGASSCWLRCGCVSGSPNTGWSYNPGSAPPPWAVHRWRSSCCHLCTSHRKERGPVQSEPGRDSSSSPGDGAPVRSGHTASCRTHHIQTQPHLNPHRRSSPDIPRLCSFLYLQLDLDHSSQAWQVRDGPPCYWAK